MKRGVKIKNIDFLVLTAISILESENEARSFSIRQWVAHFLEDEISSQPISRTLRKLTKCGDIWVSVEKRQTHFYHLTEAGKRRLENMHKLQEI